MDVNYKQKLRSIKCFVFDVDGVLTNGNLHITNDGKLLRSRYREFNARGVNINILECTTFSQISNYFD